MKPGQIELVDRGDLKPLQYNVKYAAGIYIVAEESKIINNCRSFEIDLNNVEITDFYYATVTTLESCAIGTCQVGEKSVGYAYTQYVITDKAQADYIEQLCEDGPNKHYRDLIEATFQASGSGDTLPF